MSRVLVAGAGGALGGHLVKRLLLEGHEVRAVDIKDLDEWWQVTDASLVWPLADLSQKGVAEAAVDGVDWVFNLAADMGGIQHIYEKEADCAFNVLITAHLLKASHEAGVRRFCQTSSACAYPTYLQEGLPPALKESDAWPAQPDHGYGLEKLFGEKLCEYVTRDYGLPTRVARLHNVYGPFSAWRGGREKAPAALCRKVAEARLTGSGRLDIWGDGTASRSFLYVDDFVEGIIRIMNSDYERPVNLGSEEVVSINQLADVIEEIAGTNLTRVYDTTAPRGVQGRNSDNTLLRHVTGWEPPTSLREGLEKLYPWVEQEVVAAGVTR